MVAMRGAAAELVPGSDRVLVFSLVLCVHEHASALRYIVLSAQGARLAGAALCCVLLHAFKPASSSVPASVCKR